MAPVSRRQLLRRSAFLVPTLALSPSLLAACGSDDDTDGATEGTPAGGQGASGEVGVLVGFGTGNAPDQIPPQQQLADAFEKDNPEASVNFLRIPDTDEAQRRLGVLIAADDAPEVVLPTGVYGVNLYVDQGIWLDLAPLLADAGVDLDIYEEPALRAAQATNYFGENSETVVGLPAAIFTHTVAYNKDLFAAAGVEEPPHQWDDPSWDYDKLVEVARQLTRDGEGRSPDDDGFDAGNIVQFGLGHWDTGLHILGFGGQKYDPEVRQVRLDTPEYIAGVQYGADLVHRHHVLATDDTLTNAVGDDPQLAAWQSGAIAMIDMCGCDLATWGTGIDFAWDVAPWPRGPEALVSTLNLDVGAIVARSDNQEAAFELLRFLLVEPANARTLATKGYGAMSPLVSERDAFLEEVSADFPDIDLQLFLDALPHSVNQESWMPAFAEINDMASQFLDPVFLEGAPAAEQLPLFQEAAQKAVDRWLAENELPAD
ncbi:MAG TPA: extracellular solute-binding protein [Acidimicrobiales bacterium]|nr:extracellular solute-binding protein [Acidimicrobiales bacterium]